ncbi:MAG: polysaccharide deacetylase family protein [Terriglobales bacterium]
MTHRAWGRRHWLPLIFRRPLPLGNVGPVVSFTFDDFPRTAYSVAGDILERNGVRGTYYTAMGLMNSSDGLGDYFRVEDLLAAAAAGHEIGSHTLHHVSSRATTVKTFVNEVIEGHAALRQVEGVHPTTNFAYPFGAVSAAAKRAVGNEMSSCRSTIPGVNGPIADLNLLLANPLYGGVEQMDSVRELLMETQRCAGWLIFYTHDVRISPSPYGCTPELLARTVEMTLSMSMRISTVNAVLTAAGCNPTPESY